MRQLLRPLYLESQTQHGSEQRQHERFRIGGRIRLLVDTPLGPAIRVGQLVDLSDGGCAVRVYKPVAADAWGQIDVDLGGAMLSMPIIVRWARDEVHSWKVGCVFHRPSEAKRAAVRFLLQRRRERLGPGGAVG